MNLILFGFKGCGKTHFGKLLAKEMHRSFIDTDDVISELYAGRTGRRMTCREIYRDEGETAFRALEREAIGTLKDMQNGIISLGGGAILDPGNISLLQKIGVLVYLEANPETLRTRVLNNGETPSFLNQQDPAKSFSEMARHRKPIYESIPAHRIHTETLDEAGVLASLRSILILHRRP